MATPIVVNQSTTLVQIDTTVAQEYIVRLSSVNTPGSLVTIRDITGNALTNNIIISTTKDVEFLDGGGTNRNLYRITQNYGFITVTPKTSNIWGVLNTFGFPDSSAAANINNITTTSLTVNNSYQTNAIISTASISTLSTHFVFIKENLSVGQSTIAHAGFYTCSLRSLQDIITHGTLYAGSTVSSIFGNITSTLTVPYISTQNIEIYGVLRSASTISTMGPLFVGSSISTTGNLAVGGSTFVQGELKVLNNATFQSSLSTLYRLGVGAETQLYSTLSVRHDILTNASLSTMSNVNVGGALSVMKSAFFTDQVSTQSNLTVGGALSVMSSFYTYGDAVLNSSLSVVGSISTLSNVYIASTLSVGKDLIVYGNSYFNTIAIGSNLSVGQNLFVNNNISTYSSIFAGGDLRIMGSTVLMGPVSTLSNMTVGGGISTMKDLAVAGTSYFGSTVLFQSSISSLANLMVQGHVSTLSSVAIGHNLLVQSNLLTGTFSTVGAAAFFSSMQIQGGLSVFSSITVSCNLDVGNILSVKSMNSQILQVSTLGVVQQSNFCMNISSSTLHYGLFSTFGGMDVGGPISTMNTLAVGSTIDTQFISVRQNLSTIGNACIGSSIFALSNIQSGASTIVNGGFYTNGQALFTKSVQMNSLTVDAGATVNGGATIFGATTIWADTIVQRQLTATGGLFIYDSAQPGVQNRISNDTYMSSIKTSSITVYGFQSTFGQAAFYSSVQIQDGLSVRGNINFTGTLNSNGASFTPAGINSAGNVGINKASNTTYALDVSGPVACDYIITSVGLRSFGDLILNPETANTAVTRLVVSNNVVYMMNGKRDASNNIVNGSASDFVFATWGGSPEHMRLTSIGRLGIGTTDPTEKLHVNGNIRITSDIACAGNANLCGNGSTSVFTVGAVGANTVSQFYTDSFYVGRFTDSLAKVGSYDVSRTTYIRAGTDAFNGYGDRYVSGTNLSLSGQKLYWIGPKVGMAAEIILEGGRSINGAENGNNHIYFNTNNGERGYFDETGLTVTGNITASGNVTAYSDQRAKENIVTIDSPLDKIMKMRGVYYTRKDMPGPRQVGVIAQEVEEILPEVVLTDSTEEKKKSVAYGNIVALLIEGMKAQQSTIDSLLELVRS